MSPAGRPTLLPLLLAISWLAAPVSAVPVAADARQLEFSFTPYRGDPLRQDRLPMVPGRVGVVLNGYPLVDGEITAVDALVLFRERRISPGLVLSTLGMGPLLRRGTNRLTLRFVPTDTGLPYRGRFQWAAITDRITRTLEPEGETLSNEGATGRQDLAAQGALELSQSFEAPFAPDRPWHHRPPIGGLEAADREALAALVGQRAASFAPPFTTAYGLLSQPGVANGTALRQARCLERGYAAGLRVTPAAPDQLRFHAGSLPAVLVGGARDGPLFRLTFPTSLPETLGEDGAICLSIAVALLFPPHLIGIRDGAGGWRWADP